MKIRLMGVALVALALFFIAILRDGTMSLVLLPLGLYLIGGDEREMSVQTGLSEPEWVVRERRS